MNKTTRKALEESIAHWRRLATGKMRPTEGIGSLDYALCELFIEQDCVGCPVREHTKLPICVGTPYHSAWAALAAFGYDSPQFKAAARKELKFLISLRPKKARKP